MDRFPRREGRLGDDKRRRAPRWSSNGKPVDNPARNIWVNQIALSTALNTAYFAEQAALFSIAMGFALLLDRRRLRDVKRPPAQA